MHSPWARTRTLSGRAWRDAYEALSAADEHGALQAGNLDRLATAAYLIGRDEAAAKGFERAHHAFLDEGELGRAVRCAFWLALILLLRGRHAEGGGWLGRAQHLLVGDSQARVERGYLLIPVALQALEGGDPDSAYEIFSEIAGIADRFVAPDLVALGTLGRGRALVAMGEAARGVAMLDEAILRAEVNIGVGTA